MDINEFYAHSILENLADNVSTKELKKNVIELHKQIVKLEEENTQLKSFVQKVFQAMQTLKI